jgi:hypothetical protein
MPISNPEPLLSIRQFREEVFRELGVAALEWAGRFPQRVQRTPQWAQHVWIACVEAFIPSIEQERLMDRYPALREAFTRGRTARESVRSTFTPDCSVETLRSWVQALREMGCLGVWVVVEGLEMWESPESDALKEQLRHVLSSMVWFEQLDFAIKILIPARFSAALLSTAKLQNRRIQPVALTWSVNALKEIVERRLRFLTGKQDSTLETLIQDGLLLEWLKRYGGMVPRGWLDLAYPFVKAYLEKKAPLCISEAEDIFRTHPPRLRLDVERKQVILGYSVWEVSPQSYDLLEFLYRQPDFSCTKEELYYRALRRLPNIPRKDMEGWEAPSTWWGVMDTALWRLRKDLEWDPRNPLYVLSERRKGIVRLNGVW